MRIFVALLCLASVGIAAADTPDPLAWMQPVWEDEAALTKGLRDFYKTQRAEMEQEYLVMKRHAEAGREAEAEAVSGRLTERMATIRDGYERALGKYPHAARLHNDFGEYLYDMEGKEAEALRHWHLALSYDDGLAVVHNNMGIHLFHAGRYEEGLRHLDRALKLDRDQPDFLFNMAQMYFIHSPQVMKLRGWKEKKLYKEAMKLSRRAAEEDPTDYELTKDYAVNFFAAERYGEKADWEEAAAAWQAARACAEKPIDVFHTWLNEGRAWVSAGKYDKALPCLEEALKITPDSRAAKELKSQCEAQLAEKAAG